MAAHKLTLCYAARSDLKKYLDKQLGGRLAGNGVDMFVTMVDAMC